jgi:transcriptional regulator with XRE-family HTH domain
LFENPCAFKRTYNRLSNKSNIKKYRKVQRVSQERLAEKCEIATNFLSDIETGKKWLSPDTLAKICTALDVDAGALFRCEQDLPANVNKLLEDFTKDALAKVEKSIKTLREHYISSQ